MQIRPVGTPGDCHIMSSLRSQEERELLIEILENDISDLRMEIADTDRREYREMLKNREVLMKKIQQKLEQSLAKKAAP